MHVFLVCYQNKGVHEYKNTAQNAVFLNENIKIMLFWKLKVLAVLWLFVVQ